MKMCVYGCGAVGSYLAAKLVSSGYDKVSVIARGAHLAVIQDSGLRMIDANLETTVTPYAATDTPHELPSQDIVFVTLQAHHLGAMAMSIANVLKPDGYVVFMNNGIPWWWNADGTELLQTMPRVDPDGLLWEHIGPRRALGCVVNSSNEITQPGTVVHKGLNRWILGEPYNQTSERLLNLTHLLGKAGVNAESTENIRLHVWRKLLRNIALNPISALTCLNVAQIGSSTKLTHLAKAMMSEVAEVAAAMGYDLSTEAAHEKSLLRNDKSAVGTVPVGTKPSMLQDALNQRRMEVDAILGGVQEFAHHHHVPTPAIDVALTLLEGLDQSIAINQKSG